MIVQDGPAGLNSGNAELNSGNGRCASGIRPQQRRLVLYVHTMCIFLIPTKRTEFSSILGPNPAGPPADHDFKLNQP